MSVTLKNIAMHTGLSVPTVGNVLGRAAGRYSEATRRRVLQAAEELGYKPNSSARAMQRGRTGCAALVLSRSNQSVVSHVPVGLLDGLDDGLAEHDMHLTVSRLTDEQLSRDDLVPKVLREYMADGMIVNYTQVIPPRMLALIQGHHTPVVWLNAKLVEDCVYADDDGAAESATRRLIEAGHRRIAMVHLCSPTVHPGLSFAAARPRLHYSVADRSEGYRRAMRNAGLSTIEPFADRFVPAEESVNACRALLSNADRPTAVLLYSERETAPLLLAARSLDIEIPRDLAVLHFFPIDQQVADVRVPAVPIPTVEIGRSAVRMLMRKIGAPATPCGPVAVPYGPVPDDAIRPPPA